MKLFSYRMTNRKKKVIAVLAIILTIFVVSGIYAASHIKPPTLKTNKVEELDEHGNVIESVTPTKEKIGTKYTFLFAGVDVAGYATDTMMLVSFDTNDYTVEILNIPRDTMSEVATREISKINGAYGRTGKANADNLLEEVEALVGIDIDKYAIINVDVFIKVIDLLGGVTVDVPINMYYDDPTQNLHIHLNKGTQLLDGQSAMEFVRFRKNNDGSGYPGGDLQRIETQQGFLKAALESAMKPSVITKIPSIIDTVFDNLDTDFTVGEMVWVAKEALNVDTENNINMHMLPGKVGAAYSKTYNNNQSYYFPIEDEFLALLNEYFNPTDTEITADDIQIAKQSEQYIKPKTQIKTETETTTKDETKDEQGTTSDPESSSDSSSSNGSGNSSSSSGSESGSSGSGNSGNTDSSSSGSESSNGSSDTESGSDSSSGSSDTESGSSGSDSSSGSGDSSSSSDSESGSSSSGNSSSNEGTTEPTTPPVFDPTDPEA